MSGLRKAIRRFGGATGSILMLGPVWDPAIRTLAAGGTPDVMLTNFKYQIAGINQAGQLDTGFLTTQVIPRDVAYIGIGLFVKWLAKRV